MVSIVTLYKKPETRGQIVNKKTYLVPISQLYIESGFNVRGIDEDHVESIVGAYRRGQYMPPLVVEVQSDSSMKVVDGHHRLTAIKKLVDEGFDFPRVQCESFLGGAAEQLAYMVNSSQGRNLNSVERAMAYKRLEDHGFTRSEIAEKLGRSPSDVSNHLSIAEMSEEAKSKIAAGEISASLALELSFKGGEAAVVSAVNDAKSAGKKKATRSTVTAWKPAMGKSVVAAMASYDAAVNEDESVTITISKSDWALVQSSIAAL
jgi:ParB/RepB/Spo0J family partition protein